MPDLAAFQDGFAAALTARRPRGRLAAHPGFAVYRNGCARAAVDALRANFPTIEALVGAEAFTAAALRFRDERPPATPVLADYGDSFPAWLARQPWTGELPYLADVARLDRLWTESHLAAEAPRRLRAPSPLPDFRDGPGVGLSFPGYDAGRPFRLALHPAMRFAWLETPAMTIWLAHRAPDGFDSLEPEWRPEGALFTRVRGAVAATPIGRGEHRLLLALAAGAGVADASAALIAADPKADIAGLFSRIIASGAVLPL